MIKKRQQDCLRRRSHTFNISSTGIHLIIRYGTQLLSLAFYLGFIGAEKKQYIKALHLPQFLANWNKIR
jgi:hypothetical protein